AKNAPEWWSTGRLAVGDEFTGPVTSIVRFGAFVSFAKAAGFSRDNVELAGLVHVSELAWTHIDHPEQVVSVGDMIRVRVIGIDTERKRVALSAKQTQPDPLALLAESNPVGRRVTVTVTKIVPFGWFLRLSEGVEGLMHLSEAPDGTVLEVGDLVSVWIHAIDPERMRISFTLRSPCESSDHHQA